MGWLGVVLVLYALLNIGGGIEGYVAKHSVASIISGVAAGILVVVAIALLGSNPKVAYVLAGIVALADLGFFARKLSQGAGIWPAGVMVGASVIVLICVIVSWVQPK